MAQNGEALTEEQMNEILFFQLVAMFQSAAMQQLGKLMNPVTNKIEKDLEQAKNSIDILGMLEVKTEGNLSEKEKKFLEHVLFELRMNYVDEVDKLKKEKTEDEREDEEKDNGEESPEQTEGEGEGDTPC